MFDNRDFGLPTFEDLLDEMMTESADDYTEAGDPSFGDAEPTEGAPVPSDAGDTYNEEDDDIDDEDEDDEFLDDDDEDDEDDMDLDDLSDDEVRTLASHLDDEDMLDDIDDDDEAEQVKLTPDEEVQADNMMQIAGTSALIRDELNANERAEFLESTNDLRIAVSEGFLTESMVADLRADLESIPMEDLLTEASIPTKTIIKFNKSARMKQLFALSANVSARAHNDPDYKKYKKASRIKAKYKRKFQQKYRNEALKRMRVLFARLKHSKSGILKSLGKKVD